MLVHQYQTRIAHLSIVGLIELCSDVDRRDCLVNPLTESTICDHFVCGVHFYFIVIVFYFERCPFLIFLLIKYVENALLEICVVLVVHLYHFGACIFVESSHFRSQRVQVPHYHVRLVLYSISLVVECIVQSVRTTIRTDHQ